MKTLQYTLSGLQSHLLVLKLGKDLEYYKDQANLQSHLLVLKPKKKVSDYEEVTTFNRTFWY